MFSKLFIVIFIYVQYVQSQYEGDTCTDTHTNTAGVCCRINDCRNTRDDLRNRRQLTPCSFNGFTPVVCCRTTCTRATSNVKRISEQMCEIYNSIEDSRPRTKRYHGYHHDYKPYDHSFHQWQEHRPMDHYYPEQDDQKYHYPTEQDDQKYHYPPGQDVQKDHYPPGQDGQKDHYPPGQDGQKCNNPPDQNDQKYHYPPEPTQDEQQHNVGREGDDTPLEPDLTTTTPKATFGRAFAIGGQDTFANEFPHMAAIGWPLRIGGITFKCGGSLISDRFVLTAGHCLSLARDTSLSNPQPTIVRLGDQNILDNVTDGANPVDVPISRRIPHPNYRPPNKYFDIALLEMEYPITTTPLIKPVCLWTKPIFESFSVATVTGWGTTVSGGRSNSAVLQRVTLNILETNVCQPLLQSTRNRHWQGFSDHQLCAGVLEGGKDACQGDSGGPLQIISWERNSNNKLRKRYYLIGVTSFGRECAKPNLPGVYTRVSSFLDWIEPIVWPSMK